MTIAERLAYEGLKFAKIDTPNNLLIVMLYNYIHRLVLEAVTDKRLSDDSLRILLIAYRSHCYYQSECLSEAAMKPLDIWISTEELPQFSPDRVEKCLDELQKYGYIVYNTESMLGDDGFRITFQVKFSQYELEWSSIFSEKTLND